MCVLQLFHRGQNNNHCAYSLMGISQMAMPFLSCSVPSFPCGRPPPHCGHSPAKVFRVNMSELWLKQPKQDFIQIFRNRGLCLIILLKLGADLSHHFLVLSSSPKRSKQEPEWLLGDQTVLASTATGAQSEVGELPRAMHALPLPSPPPPPPHPHYWKPCRLYGGLYFLYTVKQSVA